MSKRLIGTAVLVLAVAVLSLALWQPGAAQESAAQVGQNQAFINTGVSTRGARVLQTGEVSTLTAAVA